MSTIPEEPEDEAARNHKILQQIEANNMEVIQEAQDTPRDPPPPANVKDAKKHKGNAAQESDTNKQSNKSRGTPTLKNAHVPESPRQTGLSNKNSAKSSVSDNKGPKRGSTPSGEHKDLKDQKMAKKSQQPSSSKSSNNRSTTPHKNKDNTTKKDTGASRETSKTPSKDKDPKVLSKSAKMARENNGTNRKGLGGNGNRTGEALSKSMGHKQLTNSSPHISAQNGGTQASSHNNKENNADNSTQHQVSVEEYVPEDIEMVSPNVDKSLELDLVNEKLMALSQSEPNMMADSTRHSKLVRKNSQNKVEASDNTSIVVIEEVKAIPQDSASRALSSHNETSLPMVATGMDHLTSHSTESLPPIYTKPGIVAKDQQQQQRSKAINNSDIPNLATNTDESGAPRQVGMITKNVKQVEGLPSLIIQTEVSNSRRSSGRRGSLRRSAGKHGRRRSSGKLKINVTDSLGDRPSTRDSLLSIPYDPSFDYYSDDFDDLETESDISEGENFSKF